MDIVLVYYVMKVYVNRWMMIMDRRDWNSSPSKIQKFLFSFFFEMSDHDASTFSFDFDFAPGNAVGGGDTKGQDEGEYARAQWVHVDSQNDVEKVALIALKYYHEYYEN